MSQPEEARISQKDAERETGIDRRTFQRWAKAGKISNVKGKVLLSEIRSQMTSPIKGEMFGKSYAYDRWRARPEKKELQGKVFKAPMRYLENAAKLGIYEGIDFCLVKGVYCFLNVQTDGMVQTLTRKGSYSGCLNIIRKKQALLRGAARKATLGKPISLDEKRKVQQVLDKSSQGLPVLAYGPYRNFMEFLEKLSDEIEAGRIELDEMTFVDRYTNTQAEMTDPFCHELAHAYLMEKLLGLSPKNLPTTRQLASRWGISRQAATKRINNGFDALYKADPKLARDLKCFSLEESAEKAKEAYAKQRSIASDC